MSVGGSLRRSGSSALSTMLMIENSARSPNTAAMAIVVRLRFTDSADGHGPAGRSGGVDVNDPCIGILPNES